MISGAKRLGLAAIAASVLLSAAAQLLMKAGMVQLAAFGGVASLASAANVGAWVVAGLLCYVGSMLTWLIALSRYDLSIAYPTLSASYVLVYVVAGWLPFFREDLSGQKTVGILLIVAGIGLVTYTGRVARSSNPVEHATSRADGHETPTRNG